MPPALPPEPVVDATSCEQTALVDAPDSEAPGAEDRADGGNEPKKWSVSWGPVILLGLMAILLYHRIAIKLVTDWHELPDFSHGFLIPFFAAFLIWDNRRQLARTPLAPSWAGLSLVILGLCELLVGVFGADLFLQRTSFVLLVAGLIWTLLGKAMLGQLKFVLFVLLLAIPLPTILFNQITFPLQLRASQLASQIASAVQGPGAARRQCYQSALDAAGGCRGLQRNPIADESLRRRRHLRLFPGAEYLAPRRARPIQPPDRGRCERQPASSAPGFACSTGTRRRHSGSFMSFRAG